MDDASKILSEPAASLGLRKPSAQPRGGKTDH
jgi:hypothetical protein